MTGSPRAWWGACLHVEVLHVPDRVNLHPSYAPAPIVVRDLSNALLAGQFCKGGPLRQQSLRSHRSLTIWILDLDLPCLSNASVELSSAILSCSESVLRKFSLEHSYWASLGGVRCVFEGNVCPYRAVSFAMKSGTACHVQRRLAFCDEC